MYWTRPCWTSCSRCGAKNSCPPPTARWLLSTWKFRSATAKPCGFPGSKRAACKASLAGKVHSVEIRAEFLKDAQARLKAHGFDNVTLEAGDASRGWENHAPYDAIVVTGSLPVMPDLLPRQLAPGGRLFAVVGDDPVMNAQLLTCVSRGVYRSENLFETSLKPLVNALQPERFTF